MTRNRTSKFSKKQSEDGNTAKWLTTFNDLMTLLLTFFVLLFTMSSLDFKKMKTFQSSLQSALGILEPGNMTEVEIRQVPVNSLIEHDIYEEMIENLRKDLENESGVEVCETDAGMMIRFKETILFECGEAELDVGAFEMLNIVAKALKKMDCPITIEGHTDDIPINTQRFPSNWELSTARAVSVVKHLAEVGGIPPRRLSAVGYGESKPLYDNDNPEHQSKNRRVEILLETGDKK